MLVHFITDEPTKIPAIRAMLEPQYHIVPQLLGGGDTQISSNAVLMVDADLRERVRVEQIRLILQELSCIHESVCGSEPPSLHVAQAYAARSDCRDFCPKEIIVKLAQIEVAQRAAQLRLCHCITRDHR